MKKWGPYILAGAVLLYFLVFKKKAANPRLATGSANPADNAKRPPAARLTSNNNGLLSSLIGAGGNLLGRVLPSLLSRGGGGSGGGSGGGLGTNIPTGRAPQEKPPPTAVIQKPPPDSGPKGPGISDPLTQPDSGYDFAFRNESGDTLTWDSGVFNPFDNPSDPGNELYGGAPPFEGYAGRDLTLNNSGRGDAADFGNELPPITDLPTSTAEFNQSMLDANLASVGGNPVAEIPGYYDPTLHDPFGGNQDFLQVGSGSDPYASDPYVDPWANYDFTDPFSSFYDFNSFDYPSGTNDYPDLGSYDYSSSDGEKRAGVATSSGSGGGGGYYVPAGGNLPGTSVPVSYYPGF